MVRPKRHKNQHPWLNQNRIGHIPNGIYEATVISPYQLKYMEYPELRGSYNYWRGDKRGCSDGIYANEKGKSKN